MGVGLIGGGLAAFFLPVYWQMDCKHDSKQVPLHAHTVTQIIKTYITDDSYIPERRFSAPEIEILEISGHPKAPRIYAWAHDTDDPKKPRRHVTVLHIAPVISAPAAVRAAIVQELRNAEAEES
ncbi:MAG: hypothetical protein DMG28_12745 [Acidobacteria bacterium]|nr:MAG: hypothetical protein DMG28_12745 [Acidobacteriota bacterium]